MAKGAVAGLLVIVVGWAAWAGNSTIQFLNGNAGTAVLEYLIGTRLPAAQKVWVNVADLDLAANAVVWVSVKNPNTGDTVHLRLVAPAAGSATHPAPLVPITLVPATGNPTLTDLMLEVWPGDEIVAYYTDPTDPMDESRAYARAVLGRVHLYEGQPAYRNLVGTFSGNQPITDALTRACSFAAEGGLPAQQAMNRPWVVVAPGEYRESVNIIAVPGGQTGPTEVVLEAEVTGAARITNIDGNEPVTISRNNVTLRGFEIYAFFTGTGVHGIFAAAAGVRGVVIENNTIRNVQRDPTGAGTERNGIHFAGAVQGARIQGNTIRGAILGPDRGTSVGISFGGSATNVTVEGNTIEEMRDHGIRFTAATVQNVQILGNVIRNCDTNKDGTGSGVQFAADSNLQAVQIAGNTFTGNEHGVNLTLAGGAAARDVYIEHNLFENHRRIPDGNIADANLQAGLRVTAAGALTPTNFYVRHNRFIGNEAGILFPTDGRVRGVLITGNVIQGNDYGIWVRHQNNTIMGNDIVGNLLFAVHALNITGDPTVMVNARDNWWGHSSGPYHPAHNPAGQGNRVTDKVDFRPFRTGSAVPQGTIEARDAAIPPTAAGTFDIAFTGPNLAELQVGPGSVLTFSDATKIDVTNVTGVPPYQVLAWNYVETAGVGRLTFTVNILPGQNPQAGVIARVTVKGTGAAGDTVTMSLAPVPVDKCADKNGVPITHAVYGGTLTLSAAAPPAQAKGDVNGNGTVDITDARWAAEAAIGIRTLTSVQFAAADVAPPYGVVDITDARWIAEAVVGLRTLALPVPAASVAGGSAIVKLGAGLLEIAGAVAADVQGRILYNPASVSITGLSGLNGFEVLAWRDDPAAGVVRFAATRLHGGAAGSVLQVHARGDAGALSVALEVLRGPDGSDIPFGTAVAPVLLSVGNTPNPVTDVHTTYFHVKATVPVVEIRVSLYDLAGRLVWDSGWGHNGLAWHLTDLRGRVVANGLYLYQVQVKLEGLAGVVASGLQKLAVYR